MPSSTVKKFYSPVFQHTVETGLRALGRFSSRRSSRHLSRRSASQPKWLQHHNSPVLGNQLTPSPPRPVFPDIWVVIVSLIPARICFSSQDEFAPASAAKKGLEALRASL